MSRVKGARAAARDGGRVVGLGPLWFGFLGGAVAWTAQLLGNYFLNTLGCTTGTDLDLALHLISLVTLLVAVAAGLVAWRGWRETRTTEERGAVGRSGFMALFGVIASVLFALAIVYGGVASFVLPSCG